MRAKVIANLELRKAGKIFCFLVPDPNFKARSAGKLLREMESAVIYFQCHRGFSGCVFSAHWSR
jgi:hypothetical protein